MEVVGRELREKREEGGGAGGGGRGKEEGKSKKQGRGLEGWEGQDHSKE